MTTIERQGRPDDLARLSFPSGYGIREAAAALGLTEQQIRAFVRAGLLEPRRGARGALRFSFQDLVLLRTARDLSRTVPPRRLRAALTRLREQLPVGRDLTAVRITAEGEDLVVHDGRDAWHPASGQTILDFEVSEIAAEVAPLVRRAAREAIAEDRRLEASDWYELACDLESCEPEASRDAYRRALELDPDHADAHLNLGRLLHEEGNLSAAAAHYRQAARSRPEDATAWFNLGVCEQDRGRGERAVRYYRHAITLDPNLADAHMNLALVYEELGRPRLALRHLAIHRGLLGEQGD
ncbi:MAG: tetratricopeptide repeat protein [Candidatus Eisenbacteria bacterium]